MKEGAWDLAPILLFSLLLWDVPDDPAPFALVVQVGVVVLVLVVRVPAAVAAFVLLLLLTGIFVPPGEASAANREWFITTRPAMTQ